MRIDRPNFVDVSHAHIAYSRYYKGGWVGMGDVEVVRYLGEVGLMDLTIDPGDESRIYAKPSKLGKSIWMPWPESKWGSLDIDETDGRDGF
ncbi:MAG: hypothetical protein Q4Q58_07010 [Thermoplasmata archaeon]|nr:hypothetical protein [Thermoplasmata archaeon]